jgi:hypothetical protein
MADKGLLLCHPQHQKLLRPGTVEDDSQLLRHRPCANHPPVVCLLTT